MKKLKIILPAAIIILFLNSCEQANESEASYESQETAAIAMDSASSVSETPISSSAATYQSPDRKFIRTADLSMEVENVYKSTTNIESKLTELGGFVTESNLESRILSQDVYPVNSDSAREIRKYIVNNHLTVRVPQKELGNFLTLLGYEMKFLNYRNIKANDVNLDLLLTALEEERLNKSNKNLNELTHENGKISDKENVVENMDFKHSEINQKKISRMKMNDEIAFSTVTLDLSEKEKIAETKVINLKNYDDKYLPDFWYSAGNSLKSGFYFFQTICLAFLYIWPLWILGILVFLFIRYQIIKQKTSKA